MIRNLLAYLGLLASCFAAWALIIWAAYTLLVTS